MNLSGSVNPEKVSSFDLGANALSTFSSFIDVKRNKIIKFNVGSGDAFNVSTLDTVAPVVQYYNLNDPSNGFQEKTFNVSEYANYRYGGVNKHYYDLEGGFIIALVRASDTITGLTTTNGFNNAFVKITINFDNIAASTIEFLCTTFNFQSVSGAESNTWFSIVHYDNIDNLIYFSSGLNKNTEINNTGLSHFYVWDGDTGLPFKEIELPDPTQGFILNRFISFDEVLDKMIVTFSAFLSPTADISRIIELDFNTETWTELTTIDYKFIYGLAVITATSEKTEILISGQNTGDDFVKLTYDSNFNLIESSNTLPNTTFHVPLYDKGTDKIYLINQKNLFYEVKFKQTTKDLPLLSGDREYKTQYQTNTGNNIFSDNRLAIKFVDYKREIIYYIFMSSTNEQVLTIERYDYNFNKIDEWTDATVLVASGRTAEYCLNEDGTRIILSAKFSGDGTIYRTGYIDIDFNDFSNSTISLSSSTYSFPYNNPSNGLTSTGMNSSELFYIGDGGDVAFQPPKFYIANLALTTFSTVYTSPTSAKKITGGFFDYETKIFSFLVVNSSLEVEFWRFNYGSNTLFKSSNTLVFDYTDKNDEQAYLLSVGQELIRIVYWGSNDAVVKVGTFDYDLNEIEVIESEIPVTLGTKRFNSFVQLKDSEFGQFVLSNYYRLLPEQSTKNLPLLGGDVIEQNILVQTDSRTLPTESSSFQYFDENNQIIINAFYGERNFLTYASKKIQFINDDFTEILWEYTDDDFTTGTRMDNFWYDEEETTLYVVHQYLDGPNIIGSNGGTYPTCLTKYKIDFLNQSVQKTYLNTLSDSTLCPPSPRSGLQNIKENTVILKKKNLIIFFDNAHYRKFDLETGEHLELFDYRSQISYDSVFKPIHIDENAGMMYGIMEDSFGDKIENTTKGAKLDFINNVFTEGSILEPVDLAEFGGNTGLRTANYWSDGGSIYRIAANNQNWQGKVIYDQFDLDLNLINREYIFLSGYATLSTDAYSFVYSHRTGIFRVKSTLIGDPVFYQKFTLKQINKK